MPAEYILSDPASDPAVRMALTLERVVKILLIRKRESPLQNNCYSIIFYLICQAISANFSLSSSFLLKFRDIRKISVKPVVIQTVADYKHIGNGEQSYIGFQIDLAPGRLVKKRYYLQ